MMKSAWYFAAGILLIASLLTACSKEDKSEGVINRAKIQVVHASPTAGSLDFYLDNKKQNDKSLSFYSNTGYFDVSPSSDLSVNYRLPGTVTTIASQILNLRNRVSYTLYITGLSSGSNYSGLKTFSSADTTSTPASGNAKVRIVNAVADGADIDFYTGNNLQLGAVKNTAVGNFILMKEGKYTFGIRRAGGTSNLTATELTLESGKVYTLLARGLVGLPTGATGISLSVINNN